MNHRQRVGVPSRVIRALVLLFPRRFRRAYGDAIVEDFETLYRLDAPNTSANRFTRIRLFLATARNILSAAVAEHVSSSMTSGPIPPQRRRPRRRTTRMTHGTWQDFRFALRTLRRQPLFTTVVIVTLGLGVGTSTAIFSLVSRILWNDLPYPEPDRLVSVWTSNLARGVNRWGVSLHDYTDWRERNEVFADLAAYNINSINLSGIDQPQRITYAQVTPSFFTTLGTRPQLGRFFEEQENLPGRDDVLILSHGFWSGAMGGREDVIGKRLTVDGRPMTVVGVMPRSFAFPIPDVQVWKPFGMLPEDEGGRDGRWVSAIGRIEPNMSLETARASLDVLGAALSEQYPDTNQGFGIYIEPLLATTVGGVRASLLILWGTTGFILLIVFANIANMMLARAATRSRETAVRTALGASRPRLMRQLIIEGVPLTLLGCVVGIGVAWLSVRTLPSLVGNQIPRLDEVRLDRGVLLYSFGVSILLGLVFSALPAWRASGTRLSFSLREGRQTQGVASIRLRNGIVIMQIALAMTVVIGAGLLAKSLMALLDTDPGYIGDKVLTVRVAPSWSEMPERGQAVQLFDAIENSLSQLPSVERLAAINSLPLTGNSWGTQVERVGVPLTDQGSTARAFTRVVLPGYHETMAIPLVRGRSLTKQDVSGAPNVVLINETAARSWWPDEDPIGKAIRYDGPEPRTVIGVVGDVTLSGLGTPAAAVVYVPFAQARFGNFQNWGMTFVIRTSGDPVLATQQIVERMREVTGSVPLYAIRTMSDVLAANVASQRLYARLLTIFAAISLVLAIVGVYSVISYLVNQQRREMGVRMALGAARKTVMQHVVRRALVLSAVGIGIGMLSATFVSRALQRFLFETSPVDPLTYAVVAVIFVTAVALASLEPAVRATRVDPVRALNSE